MLRLNLRIVRPVNSLPVGCLMAAFALTLGGDLSAQARGLDFAYGRWWRGGAVAETYSLTYRRQWFGPVSYGIGVTHLDDRSAVTDRTQSGGEFSIYLGNDGRGLYALGSSGLAMRHADGSTDASWAVGAGYALRPISALSFGAEATYRVEKDEWRRSFWKFDPVVDRKGWQVRARVAIHIGRRRSVASRNRRSEASGSNFVPPSKSDISRLGRSSGASSAAAKTAADVVQTAIDVMGTPYQWGGSDENGFDCSGLIQYAYGENGIIIPRVSRDQARSGRYVEPRVADLRPGDILAFSVERSSRITHVGLYIGEGKFIHSASKGVAISSLVATDANSRWWQNRWVAARRYL